MPHAGDPRSAGLTAVVGGALYALPLVVWLRYSEDVVSSGGLAAFVAAAAGRPLALAQAAVWAFSYFLYLPYTVTDIVYEMLAEVFPGLQPWRWLLQLLLPIAIVALVVLATGAAVTALVVSAAAQLLVVLALGFLMIAKVGVPGSSFASAHGIARGGANVALLFVCGSLPLFLGAEAVGGGRTVRRSLALAGVVVAAYVVFAAFPLANVPASLVQAPLPGYAIAAAYSGRTLAVLVGVGAAVSVAGVIVAEYLALSRLLFAVSGIPVRRLLTWIAVPFVAVDAFSLLAPDAFDRNVLRPSLIALFLSQLVVFAVFPLYRARRRKLGAVDVVLAVGAFALMSWGLYRAIAAPVST